MKELEIEKAKLELEKSTRHEERLKQKPRRVIDSNAGLQSEV